MCFSNFNFLSSFHSGLQQQLENEYSILFECNEAIENLKNASDFSDYVKLLETAVKTNGFYAIDEVNQVFKKLYFAFFQFVDRPHAFDDTEQLNDVDRLHSELYEFDSMHFHNLSTDADRQECK